MGYEDVRRPAAVGEAAGRDSMYEELSLEEELPARVTAALFGTTGRICPPIFQGEGSALNWPASLSNFSKKLFRFCKFYWDGRERLLAKRAREKNTCKKSKSEENCQASCGFAGLSIEC